MSTAQLSPGTVVDGTFTIGEQTRTRAGAWSYAATNPQEHPVVLTTYDAGCFPSTLVLERSLRELRQLQSLDSPRVCRVLACGKLPEGGIFEVNAPLPSQRLDQMLDNGPLAAPEAAALISQVGDALLEGQKCGVIHRNLGPRVVFVGSEGAVVSGFAVGEPHGGKSFGPLDTIAPEQIQGKVVDQRTLIYNLAALMHMLLTGAPLYSGDAAAQLEAHLSTEPPDDLHARLKRALGKDPRMRPMMLKQFIAELRAIGGGVARAPIAPSARGPAAPPLPGEPAAGKPAGGPSSRGWTMFMKAEEDAPSSPSAAKAPEAGVPAASKPKTRGWTMFMEAADEEPAKKTTEAAPKPSTRGWTMFMEAEDGDEAKPAEAASAPAGAEDAVKPKTRGWTMFMEAGDSDEAKQAEAQQVEAKPAEAKPAEAAPAEVSPPSAGDTGAKPKTRGWTMFMEAEESDEAKAAQAKAPAVKPPGAAPVAKPPGAKPPVAAPPVAKPPVATPPVAKPPVATPPVAKPPVATPPVATPAAQAPSVSPPAAQAPSVSPPAAQASSVSPPAAQAPSVSPPAAQAPSVGSAGGPPPKSRGWTMFMEPAKDKGAQSPSAPSVAEADAAPSAEPTADIAAEPAAEPVVEAPVEPAAEVPVESAEDAPAVAADGSDEPATATPGKKGKKRGWTMFMDKPLSDSSGDDLGDVVPAADATNKSMVEFSPEGEEAAPAAVEAVGSIESPAESEPAVTPSRGTEPMLEVPAAANPEEAPVPRAKTLVATTVPSTPAAAPPAAQPAARASPRGGTLIAPPGSGAAAAGPVTGPVTGPQSGPIAPIDPPSVPAKKEKSSPVLYVALGGVVVVLAVLAFIFLR